VPLGSHCSGFRQTIVAQVGSENMDKIRIGRLLGWRMNGGRKARNCVVENCIERLFQFGKHLCFESRRT
jgi:hypothetical protein